MVRGDFLTNLYFLYNSFMQIYSDKKFENPIEIIDVSGELKEGFDRLEILRKKYYLLGYITYDFKYMYFEAFDRSEKYIPNPPKQLDFSKIILSPGWGNPDNSGVTMDVIDYYKICVKGKGGLGNS